MVKRMLKILLLLVVALPLLLLVAGQAGLLRGTPPDDLGVREGKLKRPSKTPNSVSSQTDLWPGHPMADYARIAPLTLAGDGPATLARIKALVQATDGAAVVKEEPGYLYATFTTKWLKFTDDVEFWFDPAGSVVQVRSSSRLGRKDFGVNRARVEAIRLQLGSKAPG
jgi:uncharacterized protein (DUF1499 family)